VGGIGSGASPRKLHALDLFSGLPDRYDRVGSVLSFGQDPRWRRALVEAVSVSPHDRVLDVATGTGLVARALVERYGCSVVGLDQSQDMLARAEERRLHDAAFAARFQPLRGEAERLPFGDAEFDALTFTYLLRYVDDPAAVMRELARVVKPGGPIGMVEFGVPPRRVLRAGWWLHTRLGLPLIGRLVSRDWYEVGRFLGPNIDGFYGRFPLPVLRGMWEDAGIGDVRVRRMSFGAGVVMWGTRDASRR
jgi:demethylmenaquinone methyltransferase/2-methoxy-6-polyprenyl-1,4-benzoquinol methylase